MILSDQDLKCAIRDGRLRFSPDLLDEQIGPASIDLRLGCEFKVFRPGRYVAMDPKKEIPLDYLELITRGREEPFVLHPNQFVLASTYECVKVADDLSMRVEGKSTLARMGIMVHAAGYVDPGFEGALTLEIANNGPVAVYLHPGMYICQVAVGKLTSPAECPYNQRKRSLYMGDRGPMAPKTNNLFPREQSS